MSEKPLRIISLGGLGEVGKNCWVFAYNDDFIIVDTGIGFPFNEYPGIELIFPSLDYLIENKDKIKALVITHSHEDHIGGAVRILNSLNVPLLIAPRLATRLIEQKVEDAGIEISTKYEAASPSDIKEIGDISIEFIRSTHSVPDCFALLINSPAGKVLHTGDFKFDFTPVDGEQFDLARLVEAGKEGIKLLISDSTNVERDGFSKSEKTVGPNILRIFKEARKRIFITTFSSHIHRIQQILNAARKVDRKVCIYGHSMELFSKIAKETGYLNYEDDLVVTIDDALKLPENEIVIITSGSQGEPSAVLSKIAKNEHKQLKIIPGDTVIFSANPIPGNERAVSKLQDTLSALGADLVYARSENIHVSGHASQEEQKLMIALTKPQYFFPAHGDYRMLTKHAEIGAQMGIDPKNIFILENGDALELYPDKVDILKNEVKDDPVYYDTTSGGIIDTRNLKDRGIMGQEGLILAYLMVDEQAEDVVSMEFIYRGISFKDSFDEDLINKEIEKSIHTAFERMKKFGTLDIDNLRPFARDLIYKCTEDKLFCRPLILVITQSINKKVAEKEEN